ncbi:MAG: hypothetical protein KG012_13965 [Deltaproteobacteria bacterium]|nr:hypothetical protein [Deltaproteobacteria bacterium]
MGFIYEAPNYKKGVDEMRRMFLGCIVFLFLASSVWAQERCETPVINVGSKWTVKADNGWEWTTELIGEEKDTYVFSWVFPEGRFKGEWKLFYSKKNMNCIKVIRDGKEDKETRDVFRKFYDFPLFTGKKWSYRYTAFSERTRRDVDIISELSVVGVEEVEAPAGKFKAFKVKVKSSTMGTGRDVSGVSYYWYSPDAKVRVKQEWEPGEFWRELEYTKSELISFELK